VHAIVCARTVPLDTVAIAAALMKAKHPVGLKFLVGEESMATFPDWVAVRSVTVGKSKAAASSVPAVYTVLENALAVNKKGAVMDNWGSLTEQDAALKLVKGHFALGDAGDRINYWTSFLHVVCIKREGAYSASQWPSVTRAIDIFMHLELVDIVKEPLAMAFETIGHGGKSKGSVRSVLAGFESRLKVLKSLPPHLPVVKHLWTAYEQLVEMIFQEAATAHHEMLTAPLHSATRPEVFFDGSSGKAGRLLAWFDSKSAKLAETIEDSSMGLSDADMLLLYDGARGTSAGALPIATALSVKQPKSGKEKAPAHLYRNWGHFAFMHGVWRTPDGFRFGNKDVTILSGTVPSGTCPAALAPGDSVLFQSAWCCTPHLCAGFEQHMRLTDVETDLHDADGKLPSGSTAIVKPAPKPIQIEFPPINASDIPEWARQNEKGVVAKSPRRGGANKALKGPKPTIDKAGKGRGGKGAGRGKGGGKGFGGQRQ
jgi:hypothetical protein